MSRDYKVYLEDVLEAIRDVVQHKLLDLEKAVRALSATEG